MYIQVHIHVVRIHCTSCSGHKYSLMMMIMYIQRIYVSLLPIRTSASAYQNQASWKTSFMRPSETNEGTCPLPKELFYKGRRASLREQIEAWNATIPGWQRVWRWLSVATASQHLRHRQKAPTTKSRAKQPRGKWPKEVKQFILRQQNLAFSAVQRTQAMINCLRACWFVYWRGQFRHAAGKTYLGLKSTQYFVNTSVHTARKLNLQNACRYGFLLADLGYVAAISLTFDTATRWTSPTAFTIVAQKLSQNSL